MQTAILFIFLLFGGFGILRLLGWWRRHQAMGRIPESERTRTSRHIGIRIMLRNIRALHGMDPRKMHIARGDLVMSPERMVLGSDKGVLVDLGPTHGRRLRSVRCTGPGRLVLEGDIPNARGNLGLYRFEVAVDDAPGWAAALQPFVDHTADTERYATAPPT